MNLKNPSLYEKGIGASLLLYALSLPLSMSGTNIALGALAGFTLWKCSVEKIRIHWPRSLGVLLIFFLWAAATDWIADRRLSLAPLSSFSKIWNVFAGVLIPAGVSLSAPEVKKIFKTLTVTGSAVVLAGILEYVSGKNLLGLIEGGRFNGFQSHPLHSGGLYCMLALLSLSFALFGNSGNKEKYFWKAISLLLVLGVILTRSRSYYLALTLGTMTLLSFKGVKAVVVGLLAGAVLVVCMAAVDGNFRARLQTMRLEHLDDSARIRFKLWGAARLMIEDHPAAGVGYRNWRKNVSEYSRRISDWELDDAAYAHAHNSYLTLAAETGIPGLIFFLAFWFFMIREQFRRLNASFRERESHPLILASIASLFALLAAAWFEHNLMTATLTLTLFFILGFSRAPLKT